MTKPANTHFIPALAELANQANATAQNAWLNDYRQTQIAQLQQAHFPTPQVEHFKYNRLGFFEDNRFEQLAHANDESFDLRRQAIDGLAAENTIERVVLVNGYFSSKLSQINEHRVTAFADTNTAQQAKILAQLDMQTSIAHNPFTQLNASLCDNGVLIEIDERSPPSLIEIISIIDEKTTESTLASHIFIDVAENSKATVISRALNWEVDSPNINLSTQQTLVNIGENAHFTHYALQLENTAGVFFGNSEYNLKSHATLKAFYAATGSVLKKLDITVNHLGQHAHAFLDGLYAATDDQQIDYHTTINHPLPNGQTDEVFRGIVNGQAEATFNGRIHIDEDAQKTRAELNNKNLVLSDSAQLHTKPELEIYADDVVCAHGATVSRMNDESLGYLRARGIAKSEAELMLSYGFFNEVLETLAHEEIANYLRPILFARFDNND